MVVIQMPIRQQTPIDTPEAYQTRCIIFDAERAAKMGDSVRKSNSWTPCSQEYALWYLTYMSKREELK